MIRVEVEGQPLGISFSHLKVEDDPRVQRITTCTLKNLSYPNEVILAESEAACSKRDNFQRSAGRKLALARALCQHEYGVGKIRKTDRCLKCGSPVVPFLELSKNARTKIWLAYFDAVKSVKPEPADAAGQKTEG